MARWGGEVLPRWIEALAVRVRVRVLGLTLGLKG